MIYLVLDCSMALSLKPLLARLPAVAPTHQLESSAHQLSSTSPPFLGSPALAAMLAVVAFASARPGPRKEGHVPFEPPFWPLVSHILAVIPFWVLS